MRRRLNELIAARVASDALAALKRELGEEGSDQRRLAVEMYMIFIGCMTAGFAIHLFALWRHLR